MRVPRPVGVLLVVAAAATGVALWAGANLDVAVPAAVVAAVAAALGAAVPWAESVRAVRRPFRLPEGDTLVLLRESFQSGPLGRQAILTTIRGLENSLGPGGPRLSLEEENRLRAAPRPVFREWVDRRVTELEGRS